MSRIDDLIEELKDNGATSDLLTAKVLEENKSTLDNIGLIFDDGKLTSNNVSKAKNALAEAGRILAENNLLGSNDEGYTPSGTTFTVKLPDRDSFEGGLALNFDATVFSDTAGTLVSRLTEAENKLKEIDIILDGPPDFTSLNAQKSKIEQIIAALEAGTDPDAKIEIFKEALEKLYESIAAFQILRNQISPLVEVLALIQAAIQAEAASIEEEANLAGIQEKGEFVGPLLASRLEDQLAELNERKEALARIQRELIGALGLDPELRTTFKEQCFLQRYAFDLMKIRQDDEANGVFTNLLPYEEGPESGRNRPLAISGIPFGFMNTMTMPKSTAALFDLPTSILSQLQPKISLFKVYTDPENDKEYEVEFDFPSSIEFLNSEGLKITAENALRNQSRRGYGVGIKNFGFSYEGSDPFSVKKSISADLSIFASSFEEILQERRAKNGKVYSYADLALKTGSSKMKKYTSVNPQSKINTDAVIDNLDKLKFRLKAIVGYEMPTNLIIGGAGGLTRKEISDAIYNSFVTLNLTPTTHEFKFDDSGRVNFKINYLAYVDDYFDISYFNIFSDPRVTSGIFKRKVLRKYYEQECLFEKIKDLKDQEDKLTPENQRASLRRILEKLLIKEKIQLINVNYSELGNFVLNPLVDLNSVVSTAASPVETPSTPTPDTPKAASTNSPPESEASGGSLLDSIKDVVTSAARAVADATLGERNEDLVGLEGRGNVAGLDQNRFRTSGPSRRASAGINSNVDEQIAYFYLYDLVEVVMDNIEESLSESGYAKVLDQIENVPLEFLNAERKILKSMRENFKRYRVVLGPVELRDPTTPGFFRNGSLADIPISVSYFVEWMTEKVVARDRLEYNINSFVSDIVKNYVRSFLNSEDCFNGEVKQRISTFSTAVTSYRPPGAENDEISEKILEQMKKTRELDARLKLFYQGTVTVFSDSLLNTMGVRNDSRSRRDISRETNYQIYYAGRSQPHDSKVGDYAMDSENGIFHYVLGKDSGIIKNIDLTRTDAQGLKELRFEQEGFDGLQQLREVYNASVTTFAFPSAYPGTYIFIDPRGFAPDTNQATATFNKYDLSKYGIGGYFMITRAETDFSEGLAETKLSAVWVHQIDGDDTDSNMRGKIENNSSRSKKCKSKRSINKGSSKAAPTGETAASSKDEVGVP